MPIGINKKYASVGDALYEQATQSEWFSNDSYQETIKETGSGQDYLMLIESVRRYNELHPDQKIEDLGLNKDYYKYLSGTGKIAYLNENVYGDRNSDEYKQTMAILDQEVHDAKNREIYENSNWLEKTFATIGSFAGHLVEGFVKGFEGVVDIVSSAVGSVGGIFDKGFERDVKNFIGRDLTGEAFGNALKEFDAKYTIMDKNLFGNVLSGLANAVGQFAWNAIPGVGTGIYWAGMIGNGIEQSVQLEQQYDLNYDSIWANIGFGSTVGVIEAAAEKFMGGKGIQKIVFKGTSKIASKTSGSAFRRIGTDFAKEGVEEMASEIADDLLAYAYSGSLKELPSLENVLVAGLIGGIMGFGVSAGQIGKTKAQYITADGQLISVKDYEANKQQYAGAKLMSKTQTLAVQESIQGILDVDINRNVTQLQKKYNMSIEQLKTQHKDEYENATANDTQTAENAFKKTTWLSNMLSEVGKDTFAKSFELYQNLADKKFQLIQNWANNQRVKLTDTQAKYIKDRFERDNPGANLSLKTDNLTSQEIAMQKALNAKGISLWFADFGAQNGDFYENAVNIDDNTIVISKDLANTMSLEQIQKQVVKHEVAHTLQRFMTTIPPKGLVALNKLLLQAYGDNPIPSVLDEAYKNESNLTKITEAQANALAEILVDDQFTIDNLFLSARPWYRKIFNNCFNELRKTIKTKDGSKLKTLKYNYVNKVMNKYKQSLLSYVGNKEDMENEISELDITDEEATALMQTYLEDKYFSKNYTISKDQFSFRNTARLEAERILTNNRKTQTADPIDYANVFNPETYKTEFVKSVMELNPNRGFKYNLQTLLLNNTNFQVSQENQCLVESVDLDNMLKPEIMNLEDIKQLKNKTLKDIVKDDFANVFINEDGSNALDSIKIVISKARSKKFAESNYSLVNDVPTITIYTDGITNDTLTKNTFLGVLMTEITHALADVKGVARGTTPAIIEKSIRENMSDKDLLFVAKELFTTEHYNEISNDKTRLINDVAYAIYTCTDGAVLRSDKQLKKQTGTKPQFYTNENGFVNKLGGVQGFGIFKNITLPHPIEMTTRMKIEVEKIKQGTDEVLFSKENKTEKLDNIPEQYNGLKYDTFEIINKGITQLEQERLKLFIHADVIKLKEYYDMDLERRYKRGLLSKGEFDEATEEFKQLKHKTGFVYRGNGKWAVTNAYRQRIARIFDKKTSPTEEDYEEIREAVYYSLVYKNKKFMAYRTSFKTDDGEICLVLNDTLIPRWFIEKEQEYNDKFGIDGIDFVFSYPNYGIDDILASDIQGFYGLDSFHMNMICINVNTLIYSSPETVLAHELTHHIQNSVTGFADDSEIKIRYNEFLAELTKLITPDEYKHLTNQVNLAYKLADINVDEDMSNISTTFHREFWARVFSLDTFTLEEYSNLIGKHFKNEKEIKNITQEFFTWYKNEVKPITEYDFRDFESDYYDYSKSDASPKTKFLAHFKNKSIKDLQEMGIPDDIIDDIIKQTADKRTISTAIIDGSLDNTQVINWFIQSFYNNKNITSVAKAKQTIKDLRNIEIRIENVNDTELLYQVINNDLDVNDEKAIKKMFDNIERLKNERALEVAEYQENINIDEEADKLTEEIDYDNESATEDSLLVGEGLSYETGGGRRITKTSTFKKLNPHEFATIKPAVKDLVDSLGDIESAKKSLEMLSKKDNAFKELLNFFSEQAKKLNMSVENFIRELLENDLQLYIDLAKYEFNTLNTKEDFEDKYSELYTDNADYVETFKSLYGDEGLTKIRNTLKTLKNSKFKQKVVEKPKKEPIQSETRAKTEKLDEQKVVEKTVKKEPKKEEKKEPEIKTKKEAPQVKAPIKKEQLKELMSERQPVAPKLDKKKPRRVKLVEKRGNTMIITIDNTLMTAEIILGEKEEGLENSPIIEMTLKDGGTIVTAYKEGKWTKALDETYAPWIKDVINFVRHYEGQTKTNTEGWSEGLKKAITKTKYRYATNNDVKHINNQENVHMISNMKEFLYRNVDYLSRFGKQEFEEFLDKCCQEDSRFNAEELVNTVILAMYLKERQDTKFKDKQYKPLFKQLDDWLSKVISLAGKELQIWSTMLRKANPLLGIEKQFKEEFGKEVELSKELRDKYTKALFDAANPEKITHSEAYENLAKVEEEVMEEVSKQVPNDRYHVFEKGISFEERKQRWANLLGAINSFRYMAMLSGISTHVVNVVSNYGIKVLESGAYKLLNLVGNKLYNDVPNQLHYRAKGVHITEEDKNKIEKRFGKMLDYICEEGKYDEHMKSDLYKRVKRSTVFATENSNTLLKTLQWCHDTIFNLLAKEDKLFTRKEITKEIAYLIKSNKQFDLDNLTAQDIDKLIDNATRRVMHSYLRDDNVLSNFLLNIKANHPTLGYLIDTVMPFPRVVGNITRRIFEFSPLGLGKGLWRLFKAKRQLKNIKSGSLQFEKSVFDDQFYIADTQLAVSRGVIGTAMMALGALLAALGIIGFDDDDKYAGVVLKIGNMKIKLSEIAPALTPILLGSTLVRSDAYPKFQERLLDVINDTTALGTFNELFTYKTSLASYVTEPISTYFTQFVPSLLRAFSKVGSNKKQIQYDYNSLGWFRTTWERIISAIPLARNMLPDKIDPYTGEPTEEYGSKWVASFVNIVLPMKISFDTDTALSNELKSIGAGTTGAQGNITINDKDLKLVGKDKEKLQADRGKYVNQLLSELVNNKKRYNVRTENGSYALKYYKNMTAKEKQQAAETLYRKATDYAKISYWISKGHKYYTSSRDEYRTVIEMLKSNRNIVYRNKWSKSKYVN